MSIIKTSSSSSTSLSVKEGFVVSTNKFSFSINFCNFKRAKDKKRLTKYRGNIREIEKTKFLFIHCMVYMLIPFSHTASYLQFLSPFHLMLSYAFLCQNYDLLHSLNLIYDEQIYY